MDAFDKAVAAKRETDSQIVAMHIEEMYRAFQAIYGEPRRTFPATAYHADTHTTDWRRALHEGNRD